MSDTKIFHEFLVEKGLLSADNMVKVLSEQARQLPLPSDLLLERGCLAAVDVLRAMVLQAKVSCSFTDACQRLGLWSDEMQSTLDGELMKRRTPLAQLLIEKYNVDAEALSQVFDEYLSEYAESNLVAVSPPVAAVSAPVAVVSAPVADAEKKPSGTAHDRFILAEVMSPDEKQHFLEALASLKEVGTTEESLSRARQGIKQCVVIAHQMRGAVKYLQISSMEGLLLEIEGVFELMVKSELSSLTARFEDIYKIISHGFEALWERRDFLLNNPEVNGAEMHACDEAAENIKMLKEVLAS